MRDQANIQQSEVTLLRAQAQLATGQLREQIDERKAAAAKRRLEIEFGKTLRFNPGRLRSSSSVVSPSLKSFKKSSRLLGSRYVADFSLPVVVGRARRSAQVARYLAYKIEAIPRSMTKRQLRSGTIIGPGSASKGARYAVGERGAYLIGDRTQRDDDGQALITSNISDDPEECFEYFDIVERNERKPSPDQSTIEFGQSRWLWRRVVDHPACEPAIIAAYHADPDGTAVIDLRRGAEALRKIIRECDDRPRAKKGKQAARDRNDGIKWRLGRGGRTQWRVMISFPREFTAAQRREALQAICDHFAAMGCMYMGVIHEAAASNDWRNDHCHIDLYDRPCRRLTGHETDDLANVSDRWIDEVRKDYRQGTFDKDIGRWDVDVARTVTYDSGNKRPQKIFRSNKSKQMRHYSMPEDSRRDIARIINQIALRDLGRASLDHRTHTEMGIPKRPDEPLGPKAHALEGKGIASEVGLRNEQKHVDARRNEIDLEYRQQIERLTAWSVQLILGTAEHRQTGARFQERDAASTALLEERDAAELKRAAALLELEINRHLSNAYNVIRTGSRVIRKGEDKRGDYAARRQAARDYWRTWVNDHSDDIQVLREMKALIKTSDIPRDIDARIAAALAQPPRAEKEMSADRRKYHGHIVPSLPLLPTKRMKSLLQQRDEGEPSAEVTIGRLTVPAPKVVEIITSPSDSVRVRKEGPTLLIVPPLHIPIKRHSAAALAPPSQAEKDILANRGEHDPIVPSLPLLPTKRMESLFQQRDEGVPSAQASPDRLIVPALTVVMTNPSRSDPICAPKKAPTLLIVPPLHIPIEGHRADVLAENGEPAGYSHVANVGHDQIEGAEPPPQQAVPDRASSDVSSDGARRLILSPETRCEKKPLDVSPGSETNMGAEPTRTRAECLDPSSDSGQAPFVRTDDETAPIVGATTVNSPWTGNIEVLVTSIPGNSATGASAESTNSLGSQPPALALAKPTNTTSIVAVEPATEPLANVGERINFEREMVLHIVRTKRIRLKKKDGVLVLPAKIKMPSEWLRHAPYLQPELARDQKLIEGELGAFVNRIRLGLVGSPPKDGFDRFRTHVFGREEEVVEALAQQKSLTAQQLAIGQGLAARQELGRG